MKVDYIYDYQNFIIIEVIYSGSLFLFKHIKETIHVNYVKYPETFSP